MYHQEGGTCTLKKGIYRAIFVDSCAHFSVQHVRLQLVRSVTSLSSHLALVPFTDFLYPIRRHRHSIFATSPVVVVCHISADFTFNFKLIPGSYLTSPVVTNVFIRHFRSFSFLCLQVIGTLSAPIDRFSTPTRLQPGLPTSTFIHCFYF
jgi:hypothetical protein